VQRFKLGNQFVRAKDTLKPAGIMDLIKFYNIAEVCAAFFVFGVTQWLGLALVCKVLGWAPVNVAITIDNHPERE